MPFARPMPDGADNDPVTTNFIKNDVRVGSRDGAPDTPLAGRYADKRLHFKSANQSCNARLDLLGALWGMSFDIRKDCAELAQR